MRMFKYLLVVSLIYFSVAIIGVFFYGLPLEIIQLIWLLILVAPFYSKWVANKLQYTRFWD